MENSSQRRNTRFRNARRPARSFFNRRNYSSRPKNYFHSNQNNSSNSGYTREENDVDGNTNTLDSTRENNPDTTVDNLVDITTNNRNLDQSNSNRNNTQYNQSNRNHRTNRTNPVNVNTDINSSDSIDETKVDKNYERQFENQINNTSQENVFLQGSIVSDRYVRNRGNHSKRGSNSRQFTSVSVKRDADKEANVEETLPQNSFLSGAENYSTQLETHKFPNNYGASNNYEYFNRNYDNYQRKFKSNYNNYKRFDKNFQGITNDFDYPRNFPSEKSYNNNKMSKNSFSKSQQEFYKNEATQRERMLHQLNKGEYECLICCDSIRTRDHIWNCGSCYHIFHLRCIRKWARSPSAILQDGNWRCPACQNLSKTIPTDYYCFCGKRRNPEINYHETPHSCGELCGKIRNENCPHRCNILCHPGPCPPCLAVVQKSCACGKSIKSSPCNQSAIETCDAVCNKVLNCGVHNCLQLCHIGDCIPCTIKVPEECYCGKIKRDSPCTKENANNKYFSCLEVCGKMLNCGQHKCKSICHEGDCNDCNLLPEVVLMCPCGKSTIENLVANGKAIKRTSCTDPIPLCGEKCNKKLSCGPKDNPHICEAYCHEGPCPLCPGLSSFKCRCGAFVKDFPCEVIKPSFIYLCERRCNKRKDCGRHKCLNNCCINSEHKCELVCNRKLSCGNHFCQEICHGGNCPPCWNVSFDELRCHCGSSVLYPPIHCGTKPPECSKTCVRHHLCNHEVHHACHDEDTCPPCTALTEKWCFGKHKLCKNVPCFLDGMSCGMPCQKSLPCGMHKCQLQCHTGSCLKPDTKCTQPCNIPRPSCGHPCGVSCHEGPCPQTPCKTKVNLRCPCGHRNETAFCSEGAKSYHLMSVSMLASKMQDIKEGQSVNLNDVLGKKCRNNQLQCNEECAVLERNKRLAIALQIQNPDLSCNPGPPSYSDFLKEEAKANPHFVSDVYEKISELVQLAKQSKQKCRSYSFPPMNRDQRRVVHELAEFFGCETQSYDEEPKKNVVVTAYKAKCWLPFVSLMSVVQRDMGLRKGPAPVLTQRTSKTNGSNPAVLSNQKKKIDYFDYNE